MTATVTPSNPPTVREPVGYSHAIQIRNPDRRVIISGQVGVALDGTIPADPEAQIAQAFENLTAVLSANSMSVFNLVKTTVFLTDRALLAPYRAARAAAFSSHAPASTLLFVSGLADPKFVVEIEAEAVG